MPPSDALVRRVSTGGNYPKGRGDDPGMRPLACSTAAIVVVLFTLAGCGSGDTTPADPSATTSTAPPPTTLTAGEEELYGPRVELPGGMLLKQIGRVAEYGESETSPRDHWAIRVVVEKIEVDPVCPHKPEPERGHRVVVTLSAQTSAYFDPATMAAPQWYRWSTVSPDGISEASLSAYNPCHPKVQLPPDFRPEAKYRGEVDVDTANPSGRIVFNDSFAWDYPTAS